MIGHFNILLALASVWPISALPFEASIIPSYFRAAIASHPELSQRSLNVGSMFGGSCNLQDAMQYMDLSAASTPSALPAPSSNLSLYHVAIGRGVQNYTCDLTNATAVPTPIGAVATLFNASCIAADLPELLAVLPGIALDLPLPSPSNFEAPLMHDISGHHYFINDFKTPYFNLDTASHSWGQGPMNKTAASNAPSTAPVGTNGAVAWLQLQSMVAPSSPFSQVYRINTAGGNPPKSCQGQQAAFEVQYAAEYWVFT